MSPLKQIILVICLVSGVAGQQYAGHVDKQIACGAAADSSRNHNESWLASSASYAAVIVGGLTALSSRFPVLGQFVGKLGGVETIGRVVEDGAKILETKGRDPNPMVDLARIIFERGSPDALKLLGELDQQLNGKTLPSPTPQPGEPPSRDECVAQLIRRIELDSAKRVAS